MKQICLVSYSTGMFLPNVTTNQHDPQDDEVMTPEIPHSFQHIEGQQESTETKGGKRELLQRPWAKNNAMWSSL